MSTTFEQTLSDILNVSELIYRNMSSPDGADHAAHDGIGDFGLVTDGKDGKGHRPGEKLQDCGAERRRDEKSDVHRIGRRAGI